MSPLSVFDPTRIGAICVSNRIAMAPLTRSRAGGAEGYTDYKTLMG